MRRGGIAAIAATAATVALVAGAATVSASPRVQQGGFDFSQPEVVADGLSIPWGLEWLPDDTALVAERDSGTIWQIGPGQDKQSVASIEVDSTDEGGLLGLEVSPDYEQDGLIYVYYSANGQNQIARMTLDGEPEVILDGIPHSNIHNGGRLQFGPDGKLWATTGDAADGDNSQDPNSLGGKILRMNPDGSAPADNPTEGSLVYSLGHRNVQGLAWDNEGGIWASELGQNTWDEVNQIEPGANYGWPDCEGTCGNPDFNEPFHTWSTAEASPSGAAIRDGMLYVGALRGERLWMVPLDGSEPSSVLDGDLGRIRTVEIRPNGWLWLTTANDGGADQVVRFPPEQG